MTKVMYFKGFTEEKKRKNFLSFINELKDNKIDVKFIGGECYKVGKETTFYGKDGNYFDLNYILFYEDNSIPLNIIKKYASGYQSHYKLIFSVLILFIALDLGYLIYYNVSWDYAPKINGIIEDIKIECYVSHGAFSADNVICKNNELNINGVWYKYSGYKIFKVGDYAEIKCLKEVCR